MTTTNRRYQGYPYVDPPVTDVPSISSDDAARWQHLPRRQIELPVRRNTTDAPDLRGGSRAPLPVKDDSNAAPVVYIDLPEASSSIVARRCSEDHDFEVIEPQNSRTSEKKDLDVPVVYIDLPEADGSDVATSWENTTQEEEPTFVQDTIFYDPFENRRIDRSKPVRDESDDESDISSHRRAFQMPTRRPNHLDLNEAGSSTGPSTYPSSSGISSLMSKEADIYGDDRFPASPIPVSQFPQPPPAYAEIDALSSPVVEQERVVEQPRPASPPKTQVILPQENVSPTPMPIGIPNPNRKYLTCHHCGVRVHTLVIKETGKITHVTALACCMIACLPAIFFIYCTDYFKVKNHYCPNCNKNIGYQQPMGGKKIFFTN